MGNLPNYRAVTKVGEKRWDEIGAAWSKTGNKISISLKYVPTATNGRMNFLLVPNTRRAKSAETGTGKVAAKA